LAVKDAVWGCKVFDVYTINADKVLVVRLSGVFDGPIAEKLAEFLEIKEVEVETGFDRFCDMTHLEGIRLLTADIVRLADRRRAFNPNDIHVKSAFWATDPLGFGIVRMYEQLLNSPRLEVRVWSDKQAAADWLGTTLDSLTP
jgi:hypothetical protein